MFLIPTGVRSFQHVDYAGLVTNVAGVVESEKITVLIEGEFLRVSQSVMDYLEVGAIRVTAEDRSTARGREVFTIFGGHVVATVTNTPVKLSVWSTNNAMHVVPHHAGPHSKPSEQLFAGVRHSVIILILKLPKVGDTGEIKGPVNGKSRKGHAVENVVHAFGIYGALVGNPVSVHILQSGDALGNRGEKIWFKLLVRKKLFAAILNGLEAEISRRQCAFAPNVEDSSAVQSIRFDGEEATLLINLEACGMLHQRPGRNLVSLKLRISEFASEGLFLAKLLGKSGTLGKQQDGRECQ